MDENDPLFMRYCRAVYEVHCRLGEAAARRRGDAVYAATPADRRRVRETLAELADAMIARGMSAAQFVGTVRTVAWEVLAPPDSDPERGLQSPTVAQFLFDAGLEYAAAVALAREQRKSQRATS